MDARTFEPDVPLPRVCKHCAWAGMHLAAEVWGVKGLMACSNPLQVWGRQPTAEEDSWKAHKGVEPDHTCDHWEERK